MARCHSDLVIHNCVLEMTMGCRYLDSDRENIMAHINVKSKIKKIFGQVFFAKIMEN